MRLLKMTFGIAICLPCIMYRSFAQFTYKIKADSVKITNDNCNAELIIENNTKHVSGYLFNTGNGRTRFQPVSSSYNA